METLPCIDSQDDEIIELQEAILHKRSVTFLTNEASFVCQCGSGPMLAVH